MGKRKNYYISRRRNNRFKFYKAIYNYHATKISVSSVLEYTGNTIKFMISNQSYMNIPDSLAAAPDWKAYATIFNSFKLRGIKITVSPHQSVGGFLGGTVQIGVLTSDDTNTFADVVESNKSIIASQADTKTLYVLPEFKSKPYVDMTVDIMRKFGVKLLKGYYLKHESCDKEHQSCRIDEFKIRKQDYAACEYTVEGDYSSASYLLSLIAINGGKAKIKNLFRNSKQGDKYILDILQAMGAKIIRGEDYVEIGSAGNLKAIDVDLSNAPDLLITVAVLAAMAEGTTNITGVKHARVKETDRIDTTCRELEKLGCKLVEHEDGMSITGGVTSGVVDSHGDHRLAMAFSLIGLKHDIIITNGEVFDVSFPNFIEAMAELGFELELENE